MDGAREVRAICVFCGSRPGADPAYAEAAEQLGRAIARRRLTLVYGGAKVGLMGVLANAALQEGGHVVGVIPKGLVSKEIAHDKLPELFLTDTMHERKARMIVLADAFISLPGGFGTYDEMFEVLTLAQIGFHDKPSGLLDVKGFFQPLLRMMEHTIRESFAAPQHADLLVADADADALIDKLVAWRPPALGEKWTDRRASPEPAAGEPKP